MQQRGQKFFAARLSSIIGLMALLFSMATQAQYPAWQTGDVILIRTNGRAATAISQTVPQAPYSHVGLLWQESGKMMVLEVWKKVQKVSLEEFTSRRAPGSKMAVFRPKELDFLAKQDPARFAELSKQLYQVFTTLKNRPYDDLYGLGKAFYCSNFVQYLLNQILQDKIVSHPMQFKAKFWREYFKEKGLTEIPRHVPGIAPGDFAQSNLFKKIFISVPAKKPVPALITPASPLTICPSLLWAKAVKIH